MMTKIGHYLSNGALLAIRPHQIWPFCQTFPIVHEFKHIFHGRNTFDMSLMRCIPPVDNLFFFKNRLFSLALLIATLLIIIKQITFSNEHVSRYYAMLEILKQRKLRMCVLRLLWYDMRLMVLLSLHYLYQSHSSENCLYHRIYKTCLQWRKEQGESRGGGEAESSSRKRSCIPFHISKCLNSVCHRIHYEATIVYSQCRICSQPQAFFILLCVECAATLCVYYTHLHILDKRTQLSTIKHTAEKLAMVA